MLKNIFALIGIIMLSKKCIDYYEANLKDGLEKKVANMVDHLDKPPADEVKA